VIATLVAAVVAASAAVFSAVVSARTASHRDRRNWQRDDRRPVLGDFLQRSERVNRAAWACLEGFEGVPAQPEMWVDDHDEYLEAYQALEQKLGEIRLSASDACAKAAVAVERAAWAAIPYIELHPALPTETLTDEFNRHIRLVEATHDAFIAAAKRDLTA
jgi:hypothetical protein